MMAQWETHYSRVWFYLCQSCKSDQGKVPKSDYFCFSCQSFSHGFWWYKITFIEFNDRRQQSIMSFGYVFNLSLILKMTRPGHVWPVFAIALLETQWKLSVWLNAGLCLQSMRVTLRAWHCPCYIVLLAERGLDSCLLLFSNGSWQICWFVASDEMHICQVGQNWLCQAWVREIRTRDLLLDHQRYQVQFKAPPYSKSQ